MDEYKPNKNLTDIQKKLLEQINKQWIYNMLLDIDHCLCLGKDDFELFKKEGIIIKDL